MVQLNDINFVKEMKMLSARIYKDSILTPENWKFIKVSPPNNRGFYAEAYRKNNTNTIVIVVSSRMG